jgi:hypothetical protein
MHMYVNLLAAAARALFFGWPVTRAAADNSPHACCTAVQQQQQPNNVLVGRQHNQRGNMKHYKDVWKAGSRSCVYRMSA